LRLRSSLGVPVNPIEEHAALTDALATQRRRLKFDEDYRVGSNNAFAGVLDVLIEELPDGTCPCDDCWGNHPIVRAARAAVGAS
jgi:hypothetical protein